MACIASTLAVAAAVALEGQAAAGETVITISTRTTVEHTDTATSASAQNRASANWTTTTIPAPPAGPVPDDAPEATYTVAFPQLAESGSNRAIRIIGDAATGEVLFQDQPAPLVGPLSNGLQIAAAGGYQTDYVWLTDNTTQDVYNVDLWIYINGTQGSDSPETWTGSARKLSGYVWFTAVQANIGNTPSDSHYAMHAGIAMANGIHNYWYFSWGGYDLYNGGQSLGSGKGNSIHLYENTWYRVRIWRVDQSGSNWNWLASVTNWSTQQEWQAGTWSLNNGRMISNAQYWTELSEPTNVGVTDYTGTQNRWVEYRDAAHGGTNQIYKQGWAHYLSTVTNTNLRSITPYINRYTVDERETTRYIGDGSLLFSNP
jgi:hypothetical protein